MFTVQFTVQLSDNDDSRLDLLAALSRAGDGLPLTEPQRQLVREHLMCLHESMQGAKPLTKRQHQVLAFVADYVHAHGYAPTFQEISRALRVTSPTVHEHLQNLSWKGYIRREYKTERGITVLRQPDAAKSAA